MTYEEFLKKIERCDESPETLLDDADFFALYQQNAQCRRAFEFHVWVTNGLREIPAEHLSKDFVISVLRQAHQEAHPEWRRKLVWMTGGIAGIAVLLWILSVFTFNFNPIVQFVDIFSNITVVHQIVTEFISKTVLPVGEVFPYVYDFIPLLSWALITVATYLLCMSTIGIFKPVRNL